MEAIHAILEAATKAPSGSNLQPWEFIVITDRELIKKVGEFYREVWLDTMGRVPKSDEDPTHRAARHLAHHMTEVPAMILVCVDHLRAWGSYQPGDPIVRDRNAASIWPAVQNLFLAARGLGLGTRLTRVHVHREDELRTILKIPEHVETVCLTPVGYPREPFSAPRRRPAGEFTSYNEFGNRHDGQ
jgi:nitroreductase